MKVFEVRTERCADEDKEIIEHISYVTSERDTLLSVTEHFTRHCEEYELALKGVREVFTIVEHIKVDP